jgi:transcriptional regulator with XRE-family HTH domain
VSVSTTFLGKYLHSVGSYCSSLLSVESRNPEKLGDYVRRIRLDKGFSTTDVERNSRSGGAQGISDAYVTRIENGYVTNVSPAKLRALAKGLQVTEDEIFAVERGQTGVGDLSLDEARLLDGYRRLARDRREIALGMMDVLSGGQASMPRHPAVTDTPPDVPLPETTTEDLGEEDKGEGWHDGHAANGKNGTDS